MNVRTLCLGVLSSGEASGYEIKKEIEEGLFSHFIDAKRSVQVPGAPFFSAAIIGLLALLVAMKARRSMDGVSC